MPRRFSTNPSDIFIYEQCRNKFLPEWQPSHSCSGPFIFLRTKMSSECYCQCREPWSVEDSRARQTVKYIIVITTITPPQFQPKLSHPLQHSAQNRDTNPAIPFVIFPVKRCRWSDMYTVILHYSAIKPYKTEGCTCNPKQCGTLVELRSCSSLRNAYRPPHKICPTSTPNRTPRQWW